MVTTDLKVESASVFVTNANQQDAKYRISANFATRNGVLTRIDNGNIVHIEDNKVVAYFSKNLENGKSYQVNYMGKAYDDRELQCEVNDFIHEYIEIGENKVYNETIE